MKSEPTIVFCTTCKGRAQHLSQTLPRNLADNAEYANARFVVLDYNSGDGLREHLLQQFKFEIESGRLVVYSFPEAKSFKMAHAKNMAARCGMIEFADILVTLDADNFTGPNFAQFIANHFREPGIFLAPNFQQIHNLPHGPLRPQRGYAGRLAIRAQDFIKAGGYDEAFDTWQGEDIDLLARLRRMGYTERYIDNCYLGAIPHGSDVRFKEYPEAQKHEKAGEFHRLSNRKDTVVNFGKIGMGVLYRGKDCVPVKLSAIPTRIFGIGMQRTATTSLDRAFQVLGLDSLHWGTGEAARIWHEMHSLGRSPTLERWYAVSDNPIPLLYQKLDVLYPGSKFILTVRDETKWLASVERLWNPDHNPARWVWDAYPISHRIHQALYGQRHFDADVFIKRYRAHNAEVLEYFKDRPDDLLVMNMEAGDGWPGLCHFLSTPIPPIPYPIESHTGITEGAIY